MTMPTIHKILTTAALCLAAWLCVAYAAPEKVALEQAEQQIRIQWQKNPNLWGNSVGARDFSPDWKHRYFGTEVPCPDNDKHQFCVSPKQLSLIAGAIILLSVLSLVSKDNSFTPVRQSKTLFWKIWFSSSVN